MIPGTLLTPGVYRGMTRLAAPLVPMLLARRTRQGKEDPARQGERQGRASLRRSAGFLVWIHAASVGESLSILPLVSRLTDEHDAINILVTSGTRTSAALLGERLPARATHQYVPVDHPGSVRRFLDHWRPDLALWVESELWPNLVLQTAARKIPMALINARMSARSARRWKRLPNLAAPLMSAFNIILAQSSGDADRFRALGATTARTIGNLKFDSPPPPAEAADVTALSAAINRRPHWLAASTHPGEEEIVATAHQTLAARHPGLLTIVCPRHPARGPEIAAQLERLGLIVARRSQGDALTPQTTVYLGDTLGEMGLFYRVADIAFIGGTLMPHAGHNPVEAAQLGCAVLAGPDMRNFEGAAAALTQAEALQTVGDAAALSAAVDELLHDPGSRAAAGDRAHQCATTLTGALDTTLAALGQWLPASNGAEDQTHADA